MGRLDGMLRCNPQREMIYAFLRAEEVLNAASLEIYELDLDEYVKHLLDRGYEADDLNEIRFMVDNYHKEDDLVEKKSFSLSILNDFQQSLLENRKKRQVKIDELFRRRQVWLYEVKKEVKFDMRLFAYPDEQKTKDLSVDLYNFIKESKMNLLIKSAIVYGQLAMIHPWHYANGRITGSIVPLLFNFLGITRENGFYLSRVFSIDKKNYYGQLLHLFDNRDWLQWVKYFLDKVLEQAIRGQKQIEHLIRFYRDFKEKSLDYIFSRETLFYVGVLLKHPIFTVKEMNERYGFSQNRLLPYIYHLLEAELLIKDNRKRNINYLFSELFSIINIR